MRTLILVLGITLALWAVVFAVLLLMGRRMAAARLVRAIPDVLTLFRALMSDPAIPIVSKAVVGLGFLYLVNPLDLIPEFVPVIGPLDDAIVGVLVLRHLVKHAGRDVVSAHWRGDLETLDMVFRLAGLRSSST